MKKIILLMTFIFAFSSMFTLTADAKLKNSPTKGYGLYSDGSTPSYDKPNGKKIGNVSWTKKELENNPLETSKPVIVIKWVNSSWVKVKYPKSLKGKATKTGYVKTKDLISQIGGFGSVAVKSKGLNLKKSPTNNSKSIAKLPLGAFVEAYDIRTDKKGVEWVQVGYVKKGKKYTGYVNKKYIIW